MSIEAFYAQYDAEQAVRHRYMLAGRYEAEHADFVMHHRHLFSKGVVDGAARFADEYNLAPSRWTHINADQPNETARFQCSCCESVLKWPAVRCFRHGCTDLSAHYGHDPVGRRDAEG